ncbi:PAS/PAC sensor hybrid histidine kinase [Lysobacter dokdonensis DS-58]|uniref:Sensory/regulatory protein RpfC n=1 Tax=Lysobacter dokdonensis DS-58 TaxID=1300345 RepID=A0A0A2WK89_9GAMM|nr:ATP-binding protein [Lysobacter dokdonensis]KGQ20198.1 PAS/PAC sensor hybrid histidine kinase [Lysobacter dokdonensis DS-58]
MRFRTFSLGMRHQLWGLFGLLLFAGMTVLVIDEVLQSYTRTSLEQMRDNSLQRLRALKAVSDGYGLDVVDTTFRVRNNLMTWDQGVRTIDAARDKVDRSWEALQPMPRDPAQHVLFEQVRGARVRANAAMSTLRAILVRRDIRALGHFADTELYPAIDPVTTRMEALSNLAMVNSERMVREEIERGRRASQLRIGLSLVALLFAGLLARHILRNVYKGVESLTALAREMRQHDPDDDVPSFRPRGELGDVMDAFLDMRRDVLRYESDLTGQLAVNEGVRAELERRGEFQRSLLNAAQVAILAMDGHGRWIMFNPFAEKLLGWQASEVIGRVPRHDMPPEVDDSPMLVPGEEVERIVAALQRQRGERVPSDWRAMYLLAELDRPPHEAVLVHRDGHHVPVVLALAAFKDEAGNPGGLIAVATDLTERKRLESALRASEMRAQEANLAKSAFLAAMSHEIRTPMVGVTGMVEILAHTQLDGDQRRALNVIQSSAQSLLQIIGDILDFSKIEAGRLELSPSAVDLRRVVRMTVANFTGSASSKGLALTCVVDDRIAPAYRADGLRVRQIVANFLSNAIKFTDFGRVEAAIEWCAAAPDAGPLGADHLRIRVTDTGIGVSAEEQARLFQPFAQVDSQTTRRFGGTGLGLAISRRLAELMGGQVSMDSAPGRGTTMQFDFTVPRVAEAEVEAQPLQPSTAKLAPRRLPTTAQAEAERSLVLLVDDHPTNRAVIARQLALAGYASESADDGEQGLVRWRSGRYALVLTDVHMPKLDGYQLARAIREEETREHRAHTPIVALTASALKGEAERCLAAGMDDYLAKPVSIPALATMLVRWLPHTDAAPAPAAELAAMLPQAERPPPIDEHVLSGLVHGDPAETRALLDDFLASTHADLATLQAARTAGDLPGVTREAHKIKGAARSIGAGELGVAADALETAGRGQDEAAVPALAADLATAVQRLVLWTDARWPRAV